jgi:hypothetical protein
MFYLQFAISNSRSVEKEGKDFFREYMSENVGHHRA